MYALYNILTKTVVCMRYTIFLPKLLYVCVIQYSYQNNCALFHWCPISQGNKLHSSK